MSRSPCPRSLEIKLNREVHNLCPICSSYPLVRAHTTKTYREVGWNYEYLLAICNECEQKVEKGEIAREYLHSIKQSLRLSFGEKIRIRPKQLSPINIASIYIGSNHILNTDVIFAYKNYRMLWFSELKGSRVLNARFYDINGTVITAIDQNQWTADRERFYDIESTKIGNEITMYIIGKKDETSIKFIIRDDSLTINESTFFIPGNKIQIQDDGTLQINGAKFKNNTFINSHIAFAFN